MLKLKNDIYTAIESLRFDQNDVMFLYLKTDKETGLPLASVNQVEDSVKRIKEGVGKNIQVICLNDRIKIGNTFECDDIIKILADGIDKVMELKSEFRDYEETDWFVRNFVISKVG